MYIKPEDRTFIVAQKYHTYKQELQNYESILKQNYWSL